MKNYLFISFLFLVQIASYAQGASFATRDLPFPIVDTLLVPVSNNVGAFITGTRPLVFRESTRYFIRNFETGEILKSNPSFGVFNWVFFRWDEEEFEGVTKVKVVRYKKFRNSYITLGVLVIEKPN